MKSILIIYSVVCVFTSALSQNETKTLGVPSRNGEKTVFYTPVYDKPEDLKMFSLMLPLWNLSASKINTSLYDLNVGAIYSDSKFQGLLRYKLGLGDRIAPDSYEGDYPNRDIMFSIYEVPKAQDLSLVGTYFFRSSESVEKQRIKLKQEGNTVTVTDIPVKAEKSVGINLGYSQGFTWYNMNNTDVRAVLGDGETEQTFNLISMSTIQTYKFVKVGLTFKKTVNVKANFEGMGERELGIVKTTWINIIGAAQNKFDDVYVPASAGAGSEDGSSQILSVTKASIDGSNKKLPVGIEFGQRFTDKKSIISLEYGVKYLPGLINNVNLMVELGVNFNINFLRGR